jgi:hypothetical protein
MSDCTDPKVSTHDTQWQPQQCVDGGIFRAKRTYTNLAVSGFNTDVGYSGHYYGMRKYTGLIPQAPYFINIEGRTGSNKPLEIPREIYEWEYGYNDNVGYSGVKIINPTNSGNFFGKSISVCEDYLAVGCPRYTFDDTEGNTLDKAGTIFVYKRNPQPSGSDWSDQYDKADWVLDQQILLPSNIWRDYVSEKIRTNTLPSLNLQLPFAVERSRWAVGQNGRQLGYSVDICSTDNLPPSLGESKKNILIASGPTCKFDRTFEELIPSGVGVGLFLFTDNFNPIILKECNLGFRTLCPFDYNYVAQRISDLDLIFRYFADPPTKFDIKINIIECPVASETRTLLDFPEPKPSFIVKRNAVRHQGLLNFNSESFQERDNNIFNSLQSAFFESFPYDESKKNNNIPAILTFYVDNSRSFGGTRALNPALDRFINFYQQYSLASGLKDIDGNPAIGYTKIVIAKNDDWMDESIFLLKDTLDLQNLRQNDIYKLFANSLGDLNSEASELNEIPFSGGSVYIFEKESGFWNLIQEIESPTRLRDVHPDYFGHSVKISDNGEVIAIGSPYLGSNNLMIYQYDKNAKNGFYFNAMSWIRGKSTTTLNSFYSNLYQEYETLTLTHSPLEAAQKIYLKLSPHDKWLIRKDYDITEYKLQSRHSNQAGGEFAWLVNEYAPCTRLGYSVAVNEDGTIVAAGAPTDSFNELDSYPSYYAPARPQFTTWPSYINAGSVSVFESRRVFPHNLAIEYGKFGNLHQDVSPSSEKPLFEHFERIFNDINIPFVKTEFTDPNIPEEAGLVIITTPYIDALSEEVFNNIRTWLSLGDRHLVLVGNDPIWEKNGIYEVSNNLINTILSRLNSGFKLVPARNEYESLPNISGYKHNIIPSFKPMGSLSINGRVSYTLPLFGSGVADIKPIHNIGRSYSCNPKRDPLSFSSIFDQDLSYNSANYKCEIPIRPSGDLRSEWNEWCINSRGQRITYPVNWPLVLGAVQQSSYGCVVGDNPADESINPTSYNMTPLLVAAEYPEPFFQKVPATPARSGLFVVGQRRVLAGTTNLRSFGKPSEDVGFIWSADSGNFTSLNLNSTNIISQSRFFDPLPYNDKDAVLQARAEPTVVTSTIQVPVGKANFIVEELYPNTNSKIIMMAGTTTETTAVLNRSFGGDPNFYYNFYNNLLETALDKGARIAQLGDWTGRSSFKDLNPNSILDVVFQSLFFDFDLNVSTQQLLRGTREFFDYDVCWLVEPLSLPNAEELNQLNEWLSRGNKKIIITYQNYDEVTLNRISQLASLLKVSMKPLFLPNKNRYAITGLDGGRGSLTISSTSFVYLPFDGSTIVDNLPEQPAFVPIDTQSGRSIASSQTEITDDNFVDNSFWKFDSGVATVNFPVFPGSGYTIFISTCSESNAERTPLSCNIKSIKNIDGAEFNYNILLDSNVFDGTVTNRVAQIVVPETNTKSTLSIEIRTHPDDKALFQTNIPGNPRTVRFISVSGALTPIVTTSRSDFVTFPILDWIVTPGSPESDILITPNARPIMTDNSKYCPDDVCIEELGNKLIADGPVVMAQEIERFSSFDYGNERSRITVISDASMIQGAAIVDQNGAITRGTISLLQSLYPPSPVVTEAFSTTLFNIRNKIQSPERSSPSILFTQTGNIGHNLRFQTPFAPASGKSLSEFVVSFESSSFKAHGNVENFQAGTYLLPVEEPKRQELIPTEKSGQLDIFKTSISPWGSYTKFAGEIDGKYYEDAGPQGGIPEILQDTGYDYLDFDRFPSGYPGDLFGYSIDLYKNKLLVGAPFAVYGSEDIVAWEDVINNASGQYQLPSGSIVGFNGGAGAVYLYEMDIGKSGITVFGKTSRWRLTRKFRPDSINIGQDTDNLDEFLNPEIFGEHNYNADDLSLSIVNDQFGHSVQINSDTIAIGAPGHDFDSISEDIYNSGAFIRKEFGLGLDIPQRNVYDLGSSGTRLLYPNSGVSVLNNGAIFTYENRIDDWQIKSQKWNFVEKIVPQGYNARKQKSYFGSSEIPVSGSENDRFGSKISLNRSKRSDSDYTLAAGTHLHKFANSGEGVLNLGSAYVYDAMLRRLPPANFDKNSFINARVFGDTNDQNQPILYVSLLNDPPDTSVYTSGVVYSNNKGEIFIEASGQDVTEKLYITHRPYIRSIYGSYVFGDPAQDKVNLFIDGDINRSSGNINLFSKVPDSRIVYNDLGLYQSAIIDFASGIPSGLSLYVHTPDVVVISSGVTLYASGTGFNPEFLNLRVRGK